MTELLANIREQPQVLADIVQYFQNHGARELESAVKLLRGRRHVALIGMGGSRYAAIPAALYFAESGMDARVLDASEALYYRALPADCAVVLVSRSGRTAELVKLAERMDREAVPYVAVTNCPESPMARCARVSVRVACEPDHGISIRTFTGTMLTLLYLAAAATNRLSALHSEALRTFSKLRAALPEWEAGVPKLFGTRHFHLLGRGYSLSAACEGSLLLQEMARTPASWHIAAEFRQGPVEALRREDAVFVFAPDGPTRELSLALIRDLRKTGASICEIAPAWPGLPEHLAAIVQIVPIQLAAYDLAALSDGRPGEFRYAAATSESEEGLGQT